MMVRKFPIEHLEPLSLLGQNDSNLRQIERTLPVRLTLRDGTITVSGPGALDAAEAIATSEAVRSAAAAESRSARRPP